MLLLTKSKKRVKGILLSNVATEYFRNFFEPNNQLGKETLISITDERADAHVLPSSALLQCHLDSSGDITSEKPNASNIHKSDIISKNIGKKTMVHN